MPRGEEADESKTEDEYVPGKSLTPSLLPWIGLCWGLGLCWGCHLTCLLAYLNAHLPAYLLTCVLRVHTGLGFIPKSRVQSGV